MQLNDEQVDRIIAVLLRVGVFTAAAVVFAGGVWFLARFGAQTPNFHVFRGEPQDLRSVSGVVGSVAHLHPRSLIQLGLLLLIATPIARVAFSVAAFAVERDRMYVAITLIVLTVLILSLSGLVTPPR